MGQKAPNSNGIVSRGLENIIRFNEIFDNVGAGIRLGGHVVDGVQFAVGNDVYGKIVYNNDFGGIKFMIDDQGFVCGNQSSGHSSGAAVGDYGANL